MSSSSSSPSDLCSHLVGDSGAEICRNLYIGDKKFASNLDALQALGITHVVNVTIDIRHYFERLEESTGHQPLTYVRYGCNDTELADLSVYFEEACKFIQSAIESGHAVLVHCQQGISRSATISIAYLMRHKGMTLTEAYTLLRTQRPVVKPKPNFLRQLAKFYDKIQAENSKSSAQPNDQTPASATSADSKSTPTASQTSSMATLPAAPQPNPSLIASTATNTVATSVSSTPVGEKRSRADPKGDEVAVSDFVANLSSSSVTEQNDEQDRASKRQKVEMEERKESPTAAAEAPTSSTVSAAAVAPTSHSAKSKPPAAPTPALVSLAMYADDDDD